jgi:hypothetical protein
MFRTSRGNSDHIEGAFPKACSSVVKARRRESKSVPRCFPAERRQEDYGYLDRGLPVCSWPGRPPRLLELPVPANPESHRTPASRHSCCWIRKPPPTRHRSNSPFPCQCYLRHRRLQRRPNHRPRLETWPSSAKQRKPRRQPEQGSRHAARVLRLPGRALETPADHGPHRKHLRHRAPPSDRRVVCRTGPRSPWFSNWSRAHRKAGAVSMATTSCRNSFLV